MSKTDRALKIAIVALGSMLVVAIAAHAATHVAAIWGLTRTHLPLLIDIAESSQLVCHWSLRLTIGVSVLSLLTMRWRRLFAAVVVLVVGIALKLCSYHFLERHPNENHVFEAVVHSGGEIEVFGRSFGVRDFSLYDLMRRANANNLILQMYDGTPQAVVDVRCDIPVEDLFNLTAPFGIIALVECPDCSVEDLSNFGCVLWREPPVQISADANGTIADAAALELAASGNRPLIVSVPDAMRVAALRLLVRQVLEAGIHSVSILLEQSGTGPAEPL